MSVATQVPNTTPAMGLTATVFDEGAVTVVALSGDADRATLHIVVETLSRVMADRAGDVVVDLARMEFMDTAVLRAVLNAREALGSRGRDLTLRSPSRIARRLLGVFGLDHLAGSKLSPVGTEPG